MTAHTPPRSLVQQLEQASTAYELINHPRTTTAAAEAHVLGLEPREVAKTVVLSTPDGFLGVRRSRRADAESSRRSRAGSRGG